MAEQAVLLKISERDGFEERSESEFPKKTASLRKATEGKIIENVF